VLFFILYVVLAFFSDYYSREDQYSRVPQRVQRADPYEQDPYGRTQTADPYNREDPYGRAKPPSGIRYRNDPYIRDDSADELDTRCHFELIHFNKFLSHLIRNACT